MGLPSAAVGDLPDLLDVDVDQLARSFSLVADRGLRRGPDDIPGDRVALAQVGHGVPAQDARLGPGWHPDLRSEDVGALAILRTSSQDLPLDLATGPGRCRVRTRGPCDQPGLALGGEAVDPGPHTLAGDHHRGADMGLFPARLVALNDEQPTVDGQPRTTVGHENLRVGVGPRQATSHFGASRSFKPARCYRSHGRLEVGA